MEVTLISRYFDTRNKGLGSYSKLIYEGLKQENISLNVLSQDQSLITSMNKFSYFFYSMMDLKRLLNKKQYKNSDVFHSLTPLESFYLPKNRSITTILDFVPFYETNNSKFSPYGKLYEKAINSALQCEKIIVINPNLKDILVSDYHVEPSLIEVISPPIDSQYQPLNKKNESYVVGTISSLGKRKRIDLLIKSFLEADIGNSKLLIGGSGEERESLMKLAKNDERIEFLGFISDDEMNDFYNSLDVFVFPTIYEGYGMPMVEAMGCGKPVITLDDADIPSNIRKRTHVCSQEDLANVLSQRKFNCDIKKNYEFFEEHSIKNISSKLMKVYENI